MRARVAYDVMLRRYSGALPRLPRALVLLLSSAVPLSLAACGDDTPKKAPPAGASSAVASIAPAAPMPVSPAPAAAAKDDPRAVAPRPAPTKLAPPVPEAREDAALAADRGVAERVVFGPPRSRPELVELYAQSDVVVFPVLWAEPFGLVPLEAMGVGRPVVATGRGGSGEYLRDEENAVLYEAGDADALAAAVRRLADDPALRARLREGGSKTAPLHTEAVFNAAVANQVEEARMSAGVPQAEGPDPSMRGT